MFLVYNAGNKMASLLDVGSASQGRELGLDAANGWPIPNKRPYKDLAPAEKLDWIKRFKELVPQARLRSTCAMYDCMGLAFASRRTVIDICHLREVLLYDGYKQVASFDKAKAGDLVVYVRNGKAEHVGIIAAIIPGLDISSSVTMVLSKWGHCGEYYHELSQVPKHYGAPTEVWTQREGI